MTNHHNQCDRLPGLRLLPALRQPLLAFFFASLCLPIAVQQATLGVLLVFLAYWGWRQGGLPPTPLDRSLLLFLSMLLLSTLCSPDVLNSFSGYRKLWLVGAFFVGYHLVQGPEETSRLITLMVTVAAIIAAYGIVQHFTGIDWARSLVGKPPNLDPFWFGRQEGFRTKGLHPSGITYAHNLLFPLLFLSTFLFISVQQWKSWLLRLSGWGLMVFSLLFSLTRGVWLAYVVVVLGFGVIKGGKVLGGVIAGMVVLGLLVLGAGAGVRERVGGVLSLHENWGRSQIWSANVDMVKERPLLGWGYGNYKKFRGPYYQRYPEADTTAHAHNNYLQIWVDSGLVGLVAFLSLFWVMLRSGWHTYWALPPTAEPARTIVLGCMLSVIGFLLGGLTQYNFGDAEVIMPLWAIAGVVMRAQKWVAET
jgi:O-Antigen ligase